MPIEALSQYAYNMTTWPNHENSMSPRTATRQHATSRRRVEPRRTPLNPSDDLPRFSRDFLTPPGPRIDPHVATDNPVITQKS
jgi:hypothetical protein